jgi:6-phosphogluconolactonase
MTSVDVYASLAELAQAAAGRVVARLAEAQAARGSASIVLTGGRSAAAIHTAVLGHPARDTVDWSRVDVWWGDERFLPAGHPDRNETQAHAQWLDALPFDQARVHPMPAADGPDGDDPSAAAARYAEILVPAGLPRFDLLLLGVGEDGHVASIFPGHPTLSDNRPVAAVLDSPKPPPVRLTLTLPVINSADEVWLIATGAEKAGAVGVALAGTGSEGLPAARVHARERTVWLLDEAAARDVAP